MWNDLPFVSGFVNMSYPVMRFLRCPVLAFANNVWKKIVPPHYIEPKTTVIDTLFQYQYKLYNIKTKLVTTLSFLYIGEPSSFDSIQSWPPHLSVIKAMKNNKWTNHMAV